MKKRLCFKDSSFSPSPIRVLSDDSASRKAPSDTNLVLYTLILPSAGPQSSRESKGDAHFAPCHSTLTLTLSSKGFDVEGTC